MLIIAFSFYSNPTNNNVYFSLFTHGAKIVVVSNAILANAIPMHYHVEDARALVLIEREDYVCDRMLRVERANLRVR